MKRLVEFNAPYYRYPVSISRGYWSRYLADAGLSSFERAQRDRWLSFAASIRDSEFGQFVSSHLASPSDTALLESHLGNHGGFAERFFVHEIRGRVSRLLAAPDIDLEDLSRLLSAAWDQDVTGSDRSMLVYWCAQSTFDEAFLQIADDSDIASVLSAWYRELSDTRMCRICRTKHRVIDLPDWIYFGSNGQQDCCFECKIVDSPGKKRLAELVPAFVATCGFIPHSDAAPINYSFTARIPEGRWTEAIKAYGAMGGIDHVKKRFGSWFIGLAETGSLPEGVLGTSRGVKCVSADGHECHSLDEQAIDNWLYANNIPHDREPSYPKHPQFNPSGRRRADWRIGNTYVEYFGLSGDSGYDKKADEKIALASSQGINLIALYPADLTNLDDALADMVETSDSQGE